jgi:hypothetical protein
MILGDGERTGETALRCVVREEVTLEVAVTGVDELIFLALTA